MTNNRNSYQKGYLGGPISTRRGPKFVIRWRVRTAKGKWKQRGESVYTTSKKVALATLDERLHEPVNSKPATLTLAEFIEGYWKPQLTQRRGVRASTLEVYESVLRRHVLPALGSLQLTEVRPLDIEELLKAKSSLSPKTRRNLVGMLGGIFRLAAENDLVRKSPIRDAHKLTLRRREKPIWTPAQVRAIVDSVPQQYHALFVCAALTGARLGELLGLQWKQINLKQGKLRIEQSLWRGRIGPLKTEASNRVLKMGQVLLRILGSHFETSPHTQPEGFVFSRPDGRPLDPGALRRDILYPTLDALGIPRTPRSAGFHTFRHSAGSFINAETGNLKAAQALLGHSTLSTTLDIYTHATEGVDREAALALERVIFGDLFADVPEIENKNRPLPVN